MSIHGYGTLGATNSGLQPESYHGSVMASLQQAQENIRQLRSIIQRIETMTKALNTASDTPHLREDLKHQRESSITIIQQTMHLLEVQPSPSEKHELERIVKEFGEVVARCKEACQVSNQRERAYPVRDAFAVHYGISDEQKRIYEAQADQITIVQSPYVKVENKIIEETNKEMHDIHDKLLIVKDLAVDNITIVNAQDDMFKQAEKNTARSSALSKRAVDELKVGMKHQSKSRRKQCCIIVAILGMVVIVAFIIALFVALAP